MAIDAHRPPRDDIYRAVSTGVELRRTNPNDMPVMVGHFARFNEWTTISSAWEGTFRERVAPGAFTKTIAENRDRMQVLYDHGNDPQLGNKPLGKIRELREDDQGAYYEVPLLDTSYNRDLLPALDAGLLGASFRFRVVREDYNAKPKRSADNPDGLGERTILEAQVAEFGPVSFPAYPGATAGIARSITDEIMLLRLAEHPEKIEALKVRTGISLSGLPNVDPYKLADALGKLGRTRKTRDSVPVDRADTCDISCLSQMLNLGAYYLSEQDETTDAADIKQMTTILHSLTSLIDGEIDETEPDETNSPMGMGMGMYSADPQGENRETEPEPSAATTPTVPGAEPEPPEATTHSLSRGLFWFADPPPHMRSK